MGYTTSGSVSTFNGASGLLQTILGLICGTEVSAESLSGSGTSWSGSLANSPVGLGRLVINYAFSSTNYEAYDDGAGNITGTNISSGSITYSSGSYSITFTGTPDATPTADYIYGNAGQDWRQEDYQNTQDENQQQAFSDCKEVVLSNTGISGQESVIVGIREWYYSSSGYYNWNLNCYSQYSAGGGWNQNSTASGIAVYDTTTENWTYHPSIALDDTTLYYWVYSNQQRIVIVVKVASYYHSCYLGFGRRFGTVGEYTTPCIAFGHIYGNRLYSDTSAANTFIAKAIGNDNVMNTIAIDPSNNYLSWLGTGDNGIITVPGTNFDANSKIGDETLGGRVMFSPIFIVANNGAVARRTLFDYDGVFHVFGDLQSEDTINLEGKSYRVFQDGFRNNWDDYMAVEEGAAISTTTTTTT
jgi:hypothetical protein